MTRVNAFTNDALGTLDAVGVAEAIRRGDLSPSDAVEAAITRIERVDPQLGAMAYRTYDRARLEARGPRSGYLAGVPTLIKDNIDVAGVPTRHGTDAYVATPARRNGAVTTMLMKMGLVSLGKSQLSEFGFSGAAEHPRLGPVRSPWDTDRIAGASSAGAGALVAAGAVPLAHGNDGGGSIRIPASVNGLVGLKPTRGRIAQDGFFAVMPVRLVADGVLTRSVRDTAVFLREAEKVHRDLRLPPIGDVTGPGRRRLRIAVVTSAVGRSASPEITELTLKTAALLEELGHEPEVTEAPVPDSFRDDFLLYWGSLALALVRLGRLQGSTWDASRLDNITLGLARHCARNLRRLPGAVMRLRHTQAIAQAFHETYDVVLTPTVAHETPRVGHLDPTLPYDVVMERLMDWVAFTPLQNATGAPAVSLPLQTTSAGLPHGMMFAAAPGREGMLLELAFELEQARPFASIQG